MSDISIDIRNLIKINQSKEQLEEKQKKDFKETLEYIRKSWFLFPSWFCVVTAISGIGAIFYTFGTSEMIIGTILLAYSVGNYMYIAGHQEGFTKGYKDGFLVGLNNSRGIIEDELDDFYDLNEREIEMLIDRCLVEFTDKI